MRIALLTTDNREHYRNYQSREPAFGAAPAALLQGMRHFPEAEIHVISCIQQQVSTPEKLADNIWLHSLVVPKSGWMRTGYQGCVRAIRTKLRELQPDIVHGQGTERECALGAVFSSYPNVVTLHGIMREQAHLLHARVGSFYWLAECLERLALRKTTGVFCNSAYTESAVRSRVRQTWPVPNAIRESFFDQPLPARPVAGKPILLNIGNISPRKRQLALLQLAERLHRAGHSFELLFVGAIAPHEPYSEAFSQKIAAAQSEGYARYAGLLEEKELIAAMDAASALVHIPSEESFGLVVAEALARNLKLFATNVGGIRDIAEETSGSELFALEEEEKLADAIIRWLENRPEESTAASAMRKRYHPKVVARRHLEIYREVLGPAS